MHTELLVRMSMATLYATIGRPRCALGEIDRGLAIAELVSDDGALASTLRTRGFIVFEIVMSFCIAAVPRSR